MWDRSQHRNHYLTPFPRVASSASRATSAGQCTATHMLSAITAAALCCPLQRAQLQEQLQQMTSTLQDQEQQLGEMQQQLQDTAAVAAQHKGTAEQKQQELDSLAGALQAAQQVC